jgi:hypothetical protein
MIPKKCLYVLFGKGLKKNQIDLKSKLFYEIIPKTYQLSFLASHLIIKRILITVVMKLLVNSTTESVSLKYFQINRGILAITL